MRFGRGIATATAMLVALGLYGAAMSAAERPDGTIVVKRKISLKIARLGPGVARYSGVVKVGGARVRGAAKASEKVQQRAQRFAQMHCIDRTRGQDGRYGPEMVTVTHLSKPPFVIGRDDAAPHASKAGLAVYSVTGAAAPAGDPVRAHVGNTTGTVRVERSSWRVVCKKAKKTKPMP